MNSPHLIVDLRDKNDYLAGHIPGARHMSLEDITREVKERDTPIALYCYHGMRSIRVARMLKERGYRNIKIIGGLHRYDGELITAPPNTNLQ